MTAPTFRTCKRCGGSGTTRRNVVKCPNCHGAGFVGGRPDPEGPVLTVRLRPVDADSLLAALEWAVNHPDLDMGPGLHREGAVEAGRRLEAVADLHRRGIA